VKALVPAGATAAVAAAAFNAPLAAVLFSLEEVVGNLHAPVLGSVVLASAACWAMLRWMLGNDPLFEVPQYQLVHPGEFGIYAVLGVAGGFVSVAFAKLLLWMRARFLCFPRKDRVVSAGGGRTDGGSDGLVRAATQDLKRSNNDGLGSTPLSEIVDTGEFPHVHGDHSLHLALDRMGASQLDLLPVVSRANVHHLEGIVTLHDVLVLYGVGPKETHPAGG